MLFQLLRRPLDASFSDPDACRQHVRQIEEAYKLLRREEVGADQVLELKLAAMYWRQKLLRRLCDRPPSWSVADHNTLTRVVDALNTRLPDTSISSLSRCLDAKSVHYLQARQGVVTEQYPELRALAGPGVTLNIRANRSSAWPFRRWKEKPAFATYEFDGDGVNFRGIHLRPGDVLLANVNIDGNGVYTTLSDPTRFSSHAAFFTILEDGDGRYPAVMETYEKGVRAVPLNVFLGPGFAAYVEVYRHRDMNESHAKQFNRSALGMLGQVHGYNFDSTDDDRRYVSCCSLGRLLHMDAGLEPAAWKSRIQDPGIRANLEKLGYTHFDFFAPVDYLLDSRFRCVGWVDNHQFEDLLARELVEGYFRELFMTRSLKPGRFPFMSRINRWGIHHIRRQTLLGKAIGAVEGFDAQSLPKGPDPLLAVITVAEAQIGRTVRRTRRWLRRFDYDPAYFSLSEFSRLPAVRQHLKNSLRLPWLD